MGHMGLWPGLQESKGIFVSTLHLLTKVNRKPVQSVHVRLQKLDLWRKIPRRGKGAAVAGNAK